MIASARARCRAADVDEAATDGLGSSPPSQGHRVRRRGSDAKCSGPCSGTITLASSQPRRRHPGAAAPPRRVSLNGAGGTHSGAAARHGTRCNGVAWHRRSRGASRPRHGARDEANAQPIGNRTGLLCKCCAMTQRQWVRRGVLVAAFAEAPQHYALQMQQQRQQRGGRRQGVHRGDAMLVRRARPRDRARSPTSRRSAEPTTSSSQPRPRRRSWTRPPRRRFAGRGVVPGACADATSTARSASTTRAAAAAVDVRCVHHFASSVDSQSCRVSCAANAATMTSRAL